MLVFAILCSAAIASRKEVFFTEIRAWVIYHIHRSLWETIAHSHCDVNSASAIQSYTFMTMDSACIVSRGHQIVSNKMGTLLRLHITKEHE